MNRPISDIFSVSPRLQAIFYMMTSVFLYTLQDVFLKRLPVEMTTFQVTYLRGAFTMLPLAYILYRERSQLGRGLIRQLAQAPLLHLARFITFFGATICFTYAFRLAPLTQAYTFSLTSCLFISFLSPFFLRDSLLPLHIITTLLGFIGALISLQPNMNEIALPSLVALLGGFLNACSLLISRRLTFLHSNALILMPFSFLTTFICWGMDFMKGNESEKGVDIYFISLTIWGLLILISGLNLMAQYLMTQAYRLATGPVLAPFDYTCLIWAMIFDIFLFHSPPSPATVLGAICILTAGLCLIYKKESD